MRVRVAALVLGLALLPARAATADTGPADVAIPPGQEELISAMLGKGELLPGGCRWAGASVDPAAIVSRYACPGGEVLLELRHPLSGAGAIVTTDRFAVALRAGQPPEGLVAALAARIHAREAAFLWSGPGRAGQVEVARTDVRLLAGALAALGVLVAGLVYGIVRARRAWGPAGPTTVARALAAALVPAAVLCVGVRRALLAFGDAILAVLEKRPPAALAPPLAATLGYVLLAAVAGFFVARAPLRRVPRGWVVVVAALYLGGGWLAGLRDPHEHRFGRLATLEPGLRPDTSPGHPSQEYSINPLGFRGPAWSLDKAPDTTRIALVGDSFVFGIGIDWPDTLGVSLEAELARRYPGRRFEMLNLGLPGENVASYLDTYEEACARLAPDVVVMCLILPNDLSRWDAQVKHRAARRAGTFSLAQHLLGPDSASMLWDYALVDVGVTPAGLANLDTAVDTLSRLRGASAGARPPALAIFTYAHPIQEVEERLARVPGATLAWPVIGESLPESFLPGDGHPTGIGNRRFASLIADGLARDGTLPPAAP